MPVRKLKYSSSSNNYQCIKQLNAGTCLGRSRLGHTKSTAHGSVCLYYRMCKITYYCVCLFLCMFVCFFACLFVCLFVRLLMPFDCSLSSLFSVCLFVCACACVCLSVCFHPLHYMIEKFNWFLFDLVSFRFVWVYYYYCCFFFYLSLLTYFR